MKTFFVKVWNAVLCIVSGVVLFLCENPISMFLFNLVCPEYASRFVTEFVGFPRSLRKFYIKHALKWPFLWSHSWMTLENLHTCSPKKQVAYYLTNLNRSKILDSMSTEGLVALMRYRPDKASEVCGLKRMTDEMFAEWLKQLVKQDSKKEHNLDYVQKLYAPLDNYLKRGKLPFSQVMLLLQAAVEEYDNSGCPLMSYVYSYIERFGLSKKQLEEMAGYMSDNLCWHDTFSETPLTEMAKEFAKQDKYKHFFNTLYDRQVFYDQRIFARTHRLSDKTEEWKAFCAENNYICPAAQKEMSINQYALFHEAGFALSVEAIKHFLQYPDRNLHRLVFRYEPLEILQKSEVQALVNNSIYMRDTYKEEVAKRTEQS